MNNSDFEFWFEFGSTYSYIAAERIEGEAELRGVNVVWRPFLLGPIFSAQGWNDSPFNLYPVKGRYMWRDMERLCDKFNLPFRRPAKFPRNGLLAARIACLEADQRWCAEFVRAVFRANFAEDRDIAETEVVGEILGLLGVEASALIARANSPENKERLRGQTERASRLGIFGAPMFRVGEEMFWGNDRLEDAFAFHQRNVERK
ncbi:MAG: 2-hydroxychromene-2-carboxylate isomerase [Candidatus Binataceae bacterium]